MSTVWKSRLSWLLLAAAGGLSAAVVLAAPKPGPRTAAETPADFVDPFIGTGGEGHTYPGATVPFGMVQLSPDTDVRPFRQSFPWAAGYRHSDSTILGFSHTHFSGTGHSDMGDVLLVPTVGPLQLDPGPADNPDSGYRSRFSHERESATPGYYSVYLSDPKIQVELTATSRVGLHRYTFPASAEARVLLDLVSSIYNYDGKVLWSQIRVESNTLVTGYRQTKGWAPNRQIYFALQFSRPFASYALFNEAEETYKGFGKSGKQLDNYPEIAGRKLKASFNFKTAAGEVVLAKVAISSVGIDGALQNLRAEVPDWDFEGVRRRAREAWNRELGRISVDGDRKQKQLFYTSLYHSMLAPVTYMDVDRRYRGADQAIHTADGFTNHHIFSLWDTFRALHPLFTIVQPERDADMIRSMLAHRSQSVHKILPVWSFGSHETWCMIGYHAVAVIADAYVKGVRGFDAAAALERHEASASYAPYGGPGRIHGPRLRAIDKEKEGASKTAGVRLRRLDHRQMARALGGTRTPRLRGARPLLPQHLRSRHRLHARQAERRALPASRSIPSTPQYGSDYTEGNAWQYSWFVPHDVKGLIDLMGGPRVFVDS
jgi:predicted alpha-1,2-mannosidase